MPVQPPKRGAIPSPRSALVAATPHVVRLGAPPNFITVPAHISMWGNDVHGDCVTAEEAFAKACNNPEIFIPDSDVISWATRHGVLDGAVIVDVLKWMQDDGFPQGSLTYDDGPYFYVDFKNSATLQSAISSGPVKIGVAADQLDTVWQGNGGRTGWFGVGFHADSNLDHCVTLCGYGTINWLAQQLQVQVPPGVDGTKSGYALFTWNSIGIIDQPSLLAITGEAWLRQPTTVAKSNLQSPRVPGNAQVGCVSRSKDKLDIFVTDNSGVIFTAAWEPDFTDWWHGWWQLNGGRAAPGAPVNAVSRSTDKLDAFVIGSDNHVYTAAWEPDFTDWWHGWWQLNGGVAAPGAPVTVVSRNTDKLDAFVVGTDGRVYTAAWEPTFTDWWHGWWPIGDIRVPQGTRVGAVSRSADKLDIFVTDVNGVIYTAAWEPAFTDGWHGWWELNGGRAAPGAPVTAVSRSTDKLDVFVVGTDGRIWTAAWEPNFTDWWHGWWPIGNITAPQRAPVHAVSRSTDKLDIFVTDASGVIHTAAWEPDFTDWWHGWWELNGGRAAPGAPVTAVSRSTDKLDVFVVGTDGRVWTAAWEPDFRDGWHGWWPIGS